MRTRSKLAIGLVLLSLILVLAGLTSFAHPYIVWVTGDRMDWASRKLAGSNATNCGRVHSADVDARHASNCALSAFRDKRPFRVRYDLIGVDAGPTVSLVGAQDGHVYELSFLSSAYGGSIFGGSVETKRCDEPVAFGTLSEMFAKSRGIISCVFSPTETIQRIVAR
jgi:hypothetical protein